MRGRVPGSRVRVWLLLEADRWVLAGVLLALVFLALAGVARLEPGAFPSALRNSDPVETLFQAMVTAIITGVTLVVSINQLVLSQELGPVGDQRSRMQGAMEFRTDVESRLERAVSPTDPASFLRALLAAIRTDARALEAAAPGRGDVDQRGGSAEVGGAGRDLRAFADEVATNASEVIDQLAGAEFGTFQVVSAALNFNYSAKIADGRRLRATRRDALSDEAAGALDDLLDELRLYGPAREHVKTLYFQWELIDLSQAMLYAAVPALTTAVAMILFYEAPGNVTGTTFGVANVFWLVGPAALVTVSPFVLLVSYVLRIATVAKRTLAIGPFVLRDGGGDGDKGGARDDGSTESE